MKKLLCVMITLLLIPITAYAAPVGTELLLLADVSGSLDATDFNLQKNGYAAAFRDAGVQALIAGTEGGVAVSLVYWSTGQSVAVGWTQLTDAASAEAFAVAIETASRPFNDSTHLADAMNFGYGLFADNGFEGESLVMDVSGDGSDSENGSYEPICIPCQDARDAALAAGVTTINALWIDDRNYFGDDPEDSIDAVLYGETNVIGGADAFAAIVDDFDDFAAGITTKIFTELGGDPVPEPATMLLFGLGLLGLAGVSRKKQ